MPPVTIIIVSYKVSAELEACLHSIAKWVSRGDADVVVVDNNSADESAEMVRIKFPWVKLHVNLDNMGFGRANNLAIRACRTPYVLLLNPDTTLVGDPLAPFLRFMNAQEMSGAASCILLEADGLVQKTTHVLPNYWTLFLHFSRARALGASSIVKKFLIACRPILGKQLNSYLESDQKFVSPRVVETIPGAFMFCRREALVAVGLFDEDYFLYSEDIDLCRRLGQSGWGVYLLPESPVRHHGGRSMDAGCGRYSPQRYRGDFLYFKKHYSPWAFLMVPLVSIPPLLLTAAAAFAKGLVFPSQRGRSLGIAREAVQVAALSLRLAAL